MEKYKLSISSEIIKNTKPIDEFIDDTLNKYFDGVPQYRYLAYLSVLKICQELESKIQFLVDGESFRMNTACNLSKKDKETIYKSVTDGLQNITTQFQTDREWYESTLKSGEKLIFEHDLYYLWLAYQIHWYNFNKVTPTMITNLYLKHNIKTIEDLLQYTPEQLSKLKGVNKTTITRLQDFLHALAIDW